MMRKEGAYHCRPPQSWAVFSFWKELLMHQKNRQQLISAVIIPAFFAVLISSCTAPPPSPSEQENLPALPTLNKDEVESKAQFCADLVRAHIDAWDGRDIETLKQFYTDDIVHYDGAPIFVGVDEVAEMAEGMWEQFPDWEMRTGKSYISAEKCLGEWVNWGVFGFPQEEPGVEVDLLTHTNGRISFWRLFYDLTFLNVFGHSANLNEDFLIDFAAAWSGGDQAEIAGIYAEEAIFVDSLFHISLEGSEAISDYALSYITQFPGAEWHLISSFAEDYSVYSMNEGDAFHPQGGVYSITFQDADSVPCEIRAVVIITPDYDNKVIEQSIYYDAESLIGCGLAE
jgi:ketosteroid isomerase-like protein